jgi:di- and tripeptidase
VALDVTYVLFFVLHSNSSWIAYDIPSITYGLRGVVHCNIEVRNRIPLNMSSFIYSPTIITNTQISSRTKDSHSGIDGGGWDEPMRDM